MPEWQAGGRSPQAGPITSTSSERTVDGSHATPGLVDKAFAFHKQWGRPVARSVSTAVAAAIVVGVVATACGRQSMAEVRLTSPSPETGPIASGLPAGVCAPTYQQLFDANATRVEAKLVTRETLLSSDPTQNPRSAWQPATRYFWIIAEVGSFPATNLGGLPRSTPFTPMPFGYVLGYRQGNVDPTDPESVAHPCRSLGFQAGPGPAWPSWFDKMTSLADVNVR